MDHEMIKKRLLEQEGYVKKVLEKKLIERENSTLYNKQLNTDLIKAIIGPRRAGKTTLGLMLLKDRNFYYVNFDDEILAKIKSEELGILLEILNELFGKRECIFLDEIQNISSWELFVNRLQRIGYNIIISGSNSKLLSKELSSHLGGRTTTLEVLPFSFKEFLKTREQTDLTETDQGIGFLKNQLKEYLSQGGFPEILLRIKDYELRKSYHDDLFSTIIFKDISQRFNIRHSSELVSIANIILNQFSTRTSFRKISKDVEISVPTVNKYLSYLEEAYLILSSKKFSHKPRKMEGSLRKYYCIDTGLLNSKKTTLTLDLGRLLENLVAIELKKKGTDFYYYLVDDKYEVDFVITKGNNVSKVIQVVNDDKELPKREIRTGILACKRLKCNTLTIITWNRTGKKKEKGVNLRMIPLWKYLTS